MNSFDQKSMNPLFILKPIDLRSDTVTQPTDKMRAAMSMAEVGDDVYQEDPTVIALEKRIATMFHKESALFFPSGTMCNLTSILCWCSDRRDAEIIVGDNSHIFLFEQGGAARFGGVSMRTVPNLPGGAMRLEDVRLAIRDNDIHEPKTALICIENTHNACGGKVLPLAFMKELRVLANQMHVPVHMDGARIWNAATALGCAVHEITEQVDSLSVCLSKGLGAPVGSLLVGPQEWIAKARRTRKALGGAMRQVGVLAAAGLRALDDFESGILLKDHMNAQWLAKWIRKCCNSFQLRDPVETNILFFHVAIYPSSWVGKEGPASIVSAKLKKKGILVSVWGPALIRMVLHRDILEKDMIHLQESLHKVSEWLAAETAKEDTCQGGIH